jgi:hypothetical protein
MRNTYTILVGKPEEKRPLGRPEPTWEDNIKMNVRETGCEDVDWICPAQDRNCWVGPCEHNNEPTGSI